MSNKGKTNGSVTCTNLFEAKPKKRREEESDSDSEEEDVKPKKKKKVDGDEKKKQVSKALFGDESSDDEDEGSKKKTKSKSAPTPKKNDRKEKESSDEESSEDEKKKKKKAPPPKQKPQKKKEESDDDESSDEEDEPRKKKSKPTNKKEDEKAKPKKQPTPPAKSKGKKKDDSDDESDEEDEESDEEDNKKMKQGARSASSSEVKVNKVLTREEWAEKLKEEPGDAQALWMSTYGGKRFMNKKLPDKISYGSRITNGNYINYSIELEGMIVETPPPITGKDGKIQRRRAEPGEDNIFVLKKIDNAKHSSALGPEPKDWYFVTFRFKGDKPNPTLLPIRKEEYPKYFKWAFGDVIMPKENVVYIQLQSRGGMQERRVPWCPDDLWQQLNEQKAGGKSESAQKGASSKSKKDDSSDSSKKRKRNTKDSDDEDSDDESEDEKKGNKKQQANKSTPSKKSKQNDETPSPRKAAVQANKKSMKDDGDESDDDGDFKPKKGRNNATKDEDDDDGEDINSSEERSDDEGDDYSGGESDEEGGRGKKGKKQGKTPVNKQKKAAKKGRDEDSDDEESEDEGDGAMLRVDDFSTVAKTNEKAYLAKVCSSQIPEQDDKETDPSASTQKKGAEPSGKKQETPKMNGEEKKNGIVQHSAPERKTSSGHTLEQLEEFGTRLYKVWLEKNEVGKVKDPFSGITKLSECDKETKSKLMGLAQLLAFCKQAKTGKSQKSKEEDD